MSWEVHLIPNLVSSSALGALLLEATTLRLPADGERSNTRIGRQVHSEVTGLTAEHALDKPRTFRFPRGFTQFLYTNTDTGSKILHSYFGSLTHAACYYPSVNTHNHTSRF